ncbi:MAG TPA: GNAT family N-acetyltransferase [Acidimicrobiales bacterium]|nr:GNAT family N-acetyltransferase [Acidimicrobiales bacterium]
MAVTIRRATLDDLDVLMELRAEVAAEGVWIGAELPLDVEGDRTRFAATIEAQADGCTDVMYVAELDDGRVVGNLSMHQRAGIATLGMNVSLHHRGAGIGVALMAAAVEWARRTGAHKVELERWPWNEPARRLYERFGFVEEGYRRRQYRRKDGSLWDSVLMGLVLDHEAPGHEIRPAEPPR